MNLNYVKETTGLRYINMKCYYKTLGSCVVPRIGGKVDKTSVSFLLLSQQKVKRSVVKVT